MPGVRPLSAAVLAAMQSCTVQTAMPAAMLAVRRSMH